MSTPFVQDKQSTLAIVAQVVFEKILDFSILDYIYLPRFLTRCYCDTCNTTAFLARLHFPSVFDASRGANVYAFCEVLPKFVSVSTRSAPRLPGYEERSFAQFLARIIRGKYFRRNPWNLQFPALCPPKFGTKAIILALIFREAFFWADPSRGFFMGVPQGSGYSLEEGYHNGAGAAPFCFKNAPHPAAAPQAPRTPTGAAAHPRRPAKPDRR